MPLELRAEDLDACRGKLRAGSKSFALASKLLPRGVREPTAVIYAFCREADDAVDAPSDDPLDAVDRQRRRLERVFAGAPVNDPVERALAVVAERFALPRAPFDALLEGFAWDARARAYDTLEELSAYATRVAGTVGVLMTALMGPRSAHVLARACDLGVAMQLTNVARDVGEDAARGRLYLPRAWMREAGLDPHAWLARPAPSEALAAVVARLLREADVLYARADAGIAALPPRCRPAVRAARLVYADIGRSVARAGYDSVRARATVSLGRKLWLALRALAPSTRGEDRLHEDALAPADFLIRACAEAD